MIFWGLALVGVGLYSGLIALSNSLNRIARQMARKNQLREAELRAQGVAFEAADPDVPDEDA